MNILKKKNVPAVSYHLVMTIVPLLCTFFVIFPIYRKRYWHDHEKHIISTIYLKSTGSGCP